MSKIKAVLLKADETITEVASKAGLKNEDGKIELAFDENRKLMIVDVVGTLDECRFTYEGVHVSKEVARQFYKKTQLVHGFGAGQERGGSQRHTRLEVTLQVAAA